MGFEDLAISMMGPLAGTMTPEGLQTTLQALQAQQQERLAANAQQAAQQSQRATQDYQQAAGQAAPDTAGSQFVPSLFSNLASVISGQGSYRENRQQQLMQEQRELMTARAENLTALRDNARQKAELAKHAGDLEAEGKHRGQIESINKALEKLKERQNNQDALDRIATEQKNRIELENLRQKNRREIQNMPTRPSSGGTPSALDPLLKERTFTTQSGREFVDVSEFSGKLKNEVMTAAAKAGLPAIGGAEARGLRDVDRARRDLSSMEEYIEGLLPKDAADRAIRNPQMKLSALMQTDEQRAAFKSFRDIAIPTLRAMIAGPGLRMSEATIKLAIDNLPTHTDTQGSAANKFRIIRQILSNAEAPIIERVWKSTGMEDKGNGAKKGDPLGVR